MPRNIPLAALALVAILAFAPQLIAEQEVTLKAGATFVGDVTLDGEEIVVRIDDADLRIPMSDVASVAAVNSGRSQQARRLLVAALEARLLTSAGREVLGLLSEAQRLAPDDPHVAFWHAYTLADAGLGKAASDVFEPRRAAIAEAYPGLADQLAARIALRTQLEKLPTALVARIDAAKAAAAQSDDKNDTGRNYAYFRLVDQHDRPIPRSAFQVQANGQQENLEAYDNGYYFFSFDRYRNSNDDPCRLDVASYGLAPKSFEFTAAERVADGGELVVERYTDEAKQALRVSVVDPQNKPIARAHISMQPYAERGATGDEQVSAAADADGYASLRVYPMTYNYTVAAEGYSNESGNLEVDRKSPENEKRIVLYPVIRGSIRVAWIALHGDSKTSGEAVIPIGEARAFYGDGLETVAWMRPTQVKDRVMLNLADAGFGYGPAFAGLGRPWVRVSEAAKDNEFGQQSADDRFNQLDLNKIDQLRDEFKLDLPQLTDNRYQGRGPLVFAVEAGNVYVGKTIQRDMRTGQPLPIAFKALVESDQLNKAEDGIAGPADKSGDHAEDHGHDTADDHEHAEDKDHEHDEADASGHGVD